MERRKEQDHEATRVAEALRRAGGALPVERLRETVGDGSRVFPGPVGRCLRRRDDLFLLVDRPQLPWGDEWSPAERTEYERAGARREEGVVLLEGTPNQPRPPALVRESLLTMWGESPDDEDLRRELGKTLG